LLQSHACGADPDTTRTASDAILSGIRKLLPVNALSVKDVSAALLEGFLIAEDASGFVIGST